MRVALVADWLPTFGGAEHVIAELNALWPDAPIFTTVASRGNLGPLGKADIRTSSLQRIYDLTQNHRMLLPWMPRATEEMDLRGYDLVFSSSHAVGKGVIPPPGALHICYCHTPMRYAWEMESQYLADFRIPKCLMRTVRGQLRRMRRWDLTTAKRVDRFIANSNTVAERIERTYARKSTVVHPPVDQRFFSVPLAERPAPYFLAVGRLVPYKRFDLLIEAANALGIPLKIAGSGHDTQRLRRMAGPNVELLGFVQDHELPELYARARALLFPQIEDAGVALLEAQACGTPVVALKQGGALDAVADGKTGLFFAEQTVSSLQEALMRLERVQFDRVHIRNHAKAFSAERFRNRIAGIVEETFATHAR